MRKYQELYTEIRRILREEENPRNKIIIRCDKEAAPTIIKGVINEKYRDSSWAAKKYYKLDIRTQTLEANEVEIQFALVRNRGKELFTKILTKNTATTQE